MDFILGLLISKGFKVFLVVVDKLSKYAHFVSLKHPYALKKVVKLFVKEEIRLHGITKLIVNDTKLKMSSFYHPYTNG
uniref:Transposon Ty3-I Gag-Pol polyprotein n=1 Tax=Cajanus cajan TaxID=3821 RepID=A0A151SYB9_CAJCA|nr:hypothetical protein KK1_015248 [Cajanus cajan]